MKEPKKNKAATSIHDILYELGDPYDTKSIYNAVYGMFRSLRRGGLRAETIFGKGYVSFRSVPNTSESKTLVRNLVILSALHMTAEQIMILLKDGAGVLKGTVGASDVLEHVFKESSGFYDVQRKAAAHMIRHGEALHQKLLSMGLRNALFTELFPEAATPEPVTQNVSLPVPPITAIHNLDQLSRLEWQPTEVADSPDGRAEYACNLFELGCYREAKKLVEGVLKTDPWHSIANYVSAMLHTAEAVLDSRMADEKQFTAELTASDGSGCASDAHEDEADQLRGAVQYHQQQSLIQCIVALKHWPKHQGHFDHSRRRTQVVKLTVGLLSAVAEGRGQSAGLDLKRLVSATAAKTESIPELDRWAMDIVKAEEPSRYGTAFDSRARDDLGWLQLYWVLDATEYHRFGEEWLHRTDSYTKSDFEQIAHQPALSRHLRHLRPDLDARRTLLKKFEDRCHCDVSSMWTAATFDMLNGEMATCYQQKKLEDALRHAKQLVVVLDRSSIAIYDHVRILYDLSRASLRRGNPVEAGRHLGQIVQEYPELGHLLSQHGHKGYLHVIDEDYGEYKDSFGNKDDIFGDGGIDEPDADAPLKQLIDRLVGSAHIGHAEVGALKSLRSLWKQ